MAKKPRTDTTETAPAPAEENDSAAAQKPQDTADTGADKAAPAKKPAPGAADAPKSDAPEPEAAKSGPAQSDPPAAAPVASPVPPALAVARGGGLAPLVLGGVLAACVGAGALYLAQAQGWVTLGGPDEALLRRIDALESDLGAAETAMRAAETEIAALKAAEPDLGAVTGAIEDVAATASAVSGEVTALATRLDATDARLAELAVQQIPEAELPQAISDAYDAKLADLLASIDTRFATLEGGLNEKLAALEQSQTAAAEAEAAAQAAARLAEARGAMAQVETALVAGAGFAEPLARIAELTDAAVPAPLAEAAETGVPSLSVLRERFPEYARAALDVSARAAADAGAISPFQAFLRTQVGARSLEAREGDDPDAVLSRAEAALARGDIAAALDEIATLPAVGQDAMAELFALAETRRTALAAAADLAAQLQQN